MDELEALKQAIIQALRASTALAAYVGDRIYDVLPQEPHLMTPPYVRMGPFDSQENGAECFESYDITAQIDVYSWGEDIAASTVESLRISAVIRGVIKEMEAVEDLQGEHVLSDIRWRSKRSITASDGKTKHVPIVISAIVDKK